MAPLLRLVFAATLFATCEGLRKSRDSNAASRARQPEIDGLYSFGAPASATSPGLQNLRGSDPCFPGLRTATISQPLLVGYVDLVVTLARPVGFRHPKIRVMELDVNEKKVEYLACELEDTQSRPSQLRVVRLDLHFYNQYVFRYPDSMRYTLFYNISFMAVYLANLADFPIVGGLVERGLYEIGWRMVARARADGGFIAGGVQYSMLAQHPGTLDCLMTFQATVSVADVWADLDIRRANFCSQPVQVHRGFRDHMLRMVRSPEWQRDIRTQLPHCNKVYVGGHSMGGANAELFTSCIQHAPFGDSHYNEMAWTKGETKAVYLRHEPEEVQRKAT